MSATRLPGCGSAAGWSLAELLVALTLMAVLASFALPGLERIAKAWTLWESAKALESSLMWGRMHSIMANESVRFDASEQGYGWSDPESGESYTASLRTFPHGVRMTSFPSRPLRFHPRGNAAPAGSYAVTDGRGAYRIVVSPGGRIRFQQEPP
ncbi:MAG: GspH/FimT family pseudopilin [Acidobacteriota bacterium]|jgi:prepilin-type N-terminal cleavage/methylation domain-containing protein|nr:GspH/FimT family pseudopilin [Acidobacteriota bacterium]NLT34153.1 prepilin-type N-terminal cleavage/methylation domain-containing protein [Acidobacteriota bacterium]